MSSSYPPFAVSIFSPLFLALPSPISISILFFSFLSLPFFLSTQIPSFFWLPRFVLCPFLHSPCNKIAPGNRRCNGFRASKSIVMRLILVLVVSLLHCRLPQCASIGRCVRRSPLVPCCASEVFASLSAADDNLPNDSGVWGDFKATTRRTALCGCASDMGRGGALVSLLARRHTGRRDKTRKDKTEQEFRQPSAMRYEGKTEIIGFSYFV